MTNLLRIEWIKIRNSKSFKVLGTIWLLAFLAIPIGVNYLIAWMEKEGATANDLLPIKLTDLPIFDFLDIWQNLAYVYKFITVLLCFVIIVNVANEFSYKTIRQNIIDGMSKREFVFSKFLLILILALIASVLLTVLGFIVGFAYSPTSEFSTIFSNFGFVGAYFLHLVLHLSYCLFFTVLIKRSGILIALLIFYSYILEPILTGIISTPLNQEWLANLLPMNVSWDLIPRPIEKYGLVQIQDYVAFSDVFVALVYITICLGSTYLLITKKDIQ
jgi:ABC-type transport system involved in multi-copper enzyme maturation permease subunit